MENKSEENYQGNTAGPSRGTDASAFFAAARGGSGEYLTLRQAKNYCDYSQDYLYYLVRQNKLRAARVGARWFTTKEWLYEYLRRPAAGSPAVVSPGFGVILAAENAGKTKTATGETAGVFDDVPCPDNGSISGRKMNNRETEGNFYFWLTAALFLLFFSLTIGKESLALFRSDTVKTAGIFLDLPDVYPEEGIGSGGGIVENFSIFYADLRRSPAISDESFSGLGEKIGSSFAADIVFAEQFGRYSEWLAESLGRKMEGAPEF